MPRSAHLCQQRLTGEPSPSPVGHGVSSTSATYCRPWVTADTLNYGLVVAEALGVDPARVFKTLVAEVDGALTVAVVRVTSEVDLKALATAVGGKKAALADRGLAEKTTGYVRGGISPLGQRKRLPTVIDRSALDSSSMFVSAGRRGLQVQLAPAELVRLTDAAVASIARA